MSESGFQITIPEFDEEDFHSTPIPFGRTAANAAFGHGFGSGGMSESPTGAITPIALPERADRTYFHARTDSLTSEDSQTSASRHLPRKPSTPFAHSTNSSINSSPFTKKPSFASIRNAFKTAAKAAPVDPPPLPPLDHSAYPVLKNPFNRSNSSLAHVPTNSFTRRPSELNSPPNHRPPTPGSNDARYARAANGRQRGHSTARSQHSHSGSIFHNSDSDHGHGHGASSSPPPVPPVPDLFHGSFGSRTDTPPLVEPDEDKVVLDPRTPSEYALHAIFFRFAGAAEMKMDTFLRQPLDRGEPPLADFMGPGIDPKFDDILATLGRIGQKNAKPVVDSIMRWRRTQHEPVSFDIVRFHIGQSPSAASTTTRHNNNSSNNNGGGIRTQDAPLILNERKSLGSIYIMCRALIAVMQSLSAGSSGSGGGMGLALGGGAARVDGGLGESLGYSLEETTFEQFRRPDLKLLAQSANHRTNAELYATLLGHLANTRFPSVSMLFLGELEPVASGQVPKDADMKYENLVRGLKHVQIKVWPPEAFEDGAEFMEALAKCFDNAHGFRFKVAFAETLVHLMHPVAKTAQAEVNHPQWAKAIEIIYPKARDMASKPRYWHVAYPLVVVSLCVAPTEYFLRNWQSCFEFGLSKLKEKPFRIPVMNGMMRLIWTYMFRCRESASTSTSKMETLLKHFFPPNRLTIFPQEDHLEPFIYIVHFAFARHFDFGIDLTLGLLQESGMKSQPANASSILSPERMAIAVQAILLTIHLMEREEPIPVWPSSPDFAGAPSWLDYPSSSDFMPPALLSKPGMQDFFDRTGTLLSHVAISCANAVGRMSIFDEQWLATRLNPSSSYEETHNYIIRRHPGGAVAYSSALVPQISLLQTCFQAWPRCLHTASLATNEAVELLIRGIIHIEPAVGEAAVLALRRFMAADGETASAVLRQYAAFLFDPGSIAQEGSGSKLVVENSRLLNLWVSLLDGWVHELLQRKVGEVKEEEKESVKRRMDESEAGALFLLCHASRQVYTVGVKVMRMLGLLVARLWPRTTGSQVELRIVDMFHGRGPNKVPLDGYDHVLEPADIERLKQWRESTKTDVFLRIADSEDTRDRTIWTWIYPGFMHVYTMDGTEHAPATLQILRETLVAATSRFHPTMALMAGLIARPPPIPGKAPGVGSGGGGGGGEKDATRNSSPEQRLLTGQWYMWTKVLCSIAAVPDHRPALVQREHSRAPSEVNFEREKLTTTRGLVRYLAPFLDSEHSYFRDAAVFCISSLPSRGYPQLLDDLGLLAHRQLFDDSRMKASMTSVAERGRRQERLFTAVARIYYYTAHYLQDQRSSGRQAALSPVLRFVRNTQAVLTSPDSRDHFKLQKLRRYFCGTVERLFDGLTTLNDTDRFIPPGMHLSLYRLCEEWCQVGRQSENVKQRLILMQRAATNAVVDPADKGQAVAVFQKETKMLSKAAIGAMAALCAKAYFPPDQSSGSPTEMLSLDSPKALDPRSTLERFTSILASLDTSIQASGKRALKALLAFGERDSTLVDEALRRSFVTAKESDTSNVRFFEVVADVICASQTHGFRFEQVACLGLFNLCHPLHAVRSLALDILEHLHEQSNGMLSISQYESVIESSAPSTYLHYHRMISDVLAGEHPDKAAAVLTQFSTWLPQMFDPASLPPVLLQSLEYWSPNIDLMEEDRSALSREGRIALYHLMALTTRYAQTHAEQILLLWTRLVDAPHQSNGHAAIRFLLEQSQTVGSIAFIQCAENVVACLSQSAIGRNIVEDLCSVIEPARMLPTIDHKLAVPDAEDVELWSDLDVLFAEQPRLSLGAGQYALLFLSNIAMDRQWDSNNQLPTVLHAVFVHLDHRMPFVREHARRMLFQVIRFWLPGYDELPDRSQYPSRASLKASVAELERQIGSKIWREDETATQSENKMQWLCARVLKLLQPLSPKLAKEWGSLALLWGTACSIRAIAFRSLQIFRALVPSATQADLALLLGRLSNTIAAPDENIQSFTSELIQTLNSLALTEELDISLVPQMYWCACACLSTTVEGEFLQVVTLLESILSRVDLKDENTLQFILSQQPPDWIGSTTLQSSLLIGLRSSKTYEPTMKMLERMAKIPGNGLVDTPEGRVRDLYTACLPRCMRAMTEETTDKDLEEFATNIGRLAELEDRPSIARIMTSFVKGRFRTKEDFLRQSVSSLREHYGSDHWTEVVTLLLGLVLNREEWLRVHSLQILKVLFQQRETRQPVDLLGSELLMPLLRLLETDLAPRALEVLEEPMTISGGLPARQVLRMSMHLSMHTKPTVKDTGPVADVFGVPQETGWCVARPDEMRSVCRANVVAVFDTCKISSRPSRVDFQPDDIIRLASPDHGDEDLGDLVQNLHELSTFFQEDSVTRRNPPFQAMPSHQLEARVAAILAKSTDPVTDVPQTPFVDVFRVDGMAPFGQDDSDNDTDYSSDSDAFVFDSPSALRMRGAHGINGSNGMNGSRTRI